RLLSFRVIHSSIRYPLKHSCPCEERGDCPGAQRVSETPSREKPSAMRGTGEMFASRERYGGSSSLNRSSRRRARVSTSRGGATPIASRRLRHLVSASLLSQFVAKDGAAPDLERKSRRSGTS